MPAWHPSTQFIVTPFGTTYAYIHIPPIDSTKPTVLLLHGFLSSSHDWRHQIAHLTSLGYGILAPDLLGFGQASKPTDVYDYKLRSQCEGIICILRRTRTSSVVGVGHDLGCVLLSRLADWFPSRFLGFVFLGSGYEEASRLDLVEVDGTAREMQGQGHGGSGWISFMAQDKQAAKLMDENLDSVLSLFYTEGEEHRRMHLQSPGATKQWLQNKTNVPLPSWMSVEEVEVKRALMRSGGFTGPICWHKMLVSDVNDKHYAASENSSTTKPVLVVQGQKADWSAKQVERTEAWARDLTLRYIDTGHWMMVENPQVVNDVLTHFLTRFERTL